MFWDLEATGPGTTIGSSCICFNEAQPDHLLHSILSSLESADRAQEHPSDVANDY